MMRRKVFLTEYRLWFALTLSAFPACTSQTVTFVHPETGATAECGASGFGIGASLSEGFVSGCGRSYENRGFVRADQLTPEQRADLERRGLLPQK